MCPKLKTKLPKICLTVCSEECECKKGFLENECGDCVKPCDCNITCTKQLLVSCPGQNELYYPCLEQKRTCDNRPKGCQCKNCKCSPCKCGQISPSKDIAPLCQLAGCDCKEGFYRNDCGICVHQKECDNLCDPSIDIPCSDQNEIRYKHFRKCDEATCGQRRKCQGEDGELKRNVCACAKYFYRDHRDRCVPKDKCSNKDPIFCTNPCKGDDAWQPTGACHDKTCEMFRLLPVIFCPRVVYTDYKCQCRDNLYREKASGKCIPGKKCPPLK